MFSVPQLEGISTIKSYTLGAAAPNTRWTDCAYQTVWQHKIRSNFLYKLILKKLTNEKFNKTHAAFDNMIEFKVHKILKKLYVNKEKT